MLKINNNRKTGEKPVKFQEYVLDNLGQLYEHVIEQQMLNEIMEKENQFLFSLIKNSFTKEESFKLGIEMLNSLIGSLRDRIDESNKTNVVYRLYKFESMVDYVGKAANLKLTGPMGIDRFDKNFCYFPQKITVERRRKSNEENS